MNTRIDVRPRVWVVDDSPLDAERARQALCDDFDTRVFGDGSTVLERLVEPDRAVPQVIVLDWVMPAVSGLEVVRFIRGAGAQLALVQLLLVTARQSPEQIVEGLNAGANDYLSKPYSPEELRARVRALLRSATLLERAASAEAALTELLASSPDAMLVLDASGWVRFANVEALRSVVPSSAVGRPLSESIPALSERLSASSSTLHDLDLNGRLYTLSLRTLPHNEDSRTIVTLRDVTERRLLDQRRLDFYSIIAHDLRTPLQAMMMRTTLLREGGRGPISPEVKAELGKLDANHRAMIALVNDFLDMARSEATSQTLRMEPVDVAAVVSVVIDGLEPLATGRAQQVYWQPMGPVMVHGDRRGLSQIVGNLLGNALKFSPTGGAVQVSVERRGDVIRTVVRDSGPGIPSADVATLFDRFTRGAAQEHREGTGLGLMIVRQLVESHGGRVGVESTTGAGSAFWFELAALEAEGRVISS